jgi:hypothetical protein
MPHIEPTGLCPCESGEQAAGCCIFGRKVRKREADTRTRGPRTCYAHPKCYAAVLSDCSEDITGEHPWSESVLQELGGAVLVSGFPWQKAERQRIGAASLTANVLCGRHNNALSPIDAESARFFRTITAFHAALAAGAGTERMVLFAGIDVERWYLKVLMGMMSAGVGRTPKGAPLPWSPPALWLRILYGEYAFPQSWGLYITGRLGEALRLDSNELSFSPLTTESAVSGCTATMAGLRFTLVLRDVGAHRWGAIDDASLRRPSGLIFRDAPSRTERSLFFTWPTEDCGRYGHVLTLDWSPDGRPPPQVRS